MKHINNILAGLVLALIIGFSGSGVAGAVPAAHQAPAPIVMEADHFKFDDQNKKTRATGHVVIIQNDLTVMGGHLEGDLDKQQVIVGDHVVIHQGSDVVNGSSVSYNYANKQGKIDTADGKLQGFFVKGETLAFSSQQSGSPSKVTHAYITKCPAEAVPCYHVTADTVEVYPGKKIVAHQAHFWLRNVMLYTQKEYVIDLTGDPDNKPQSEWPRVDYHSSVGLSVTKDMIYHLSPHNRIVLSPFYYTKKGFVLDGGWVSTQKDNTVRLEQLHWSQNNYWLKALPQFSVKSKAFPLRDWPWTYQYQVTSGYITEQGPLGDKSAWKHSLDLVLRHRPIALSPTVTWDTSVEELQNFYYGQHMRQTSWFNDVTWKATTKWTFLGSLNLSDVNGHSPFGYDVLEINKEVALGATYQFDHLWTVGSRLSFDMISGRLHDVDYTVDRNLHCFDLQIGYRAKRDEWHVKVKMTEW